MVKLIAKVKSNGYPIPWICYERSFSEFYLSIWNQLAGPGQDKILSWYILLDRYKISGRRLEILVR